MSPPPPPPPQASDHMVLTNGRYIDLLGGDSDTFSPSEFLGCECFVTVRLLNCREVALPYAYLVTYLV